MTTITTHKEESLFTMAVKVSQVSRALIMVAEDTSSRFPREHDIQENMAVLHLLSDDLDYVVRVLDAMDERIAKSKARFEDILD